MKERTKKSGRKIQESTVKNEGKNRNIRGKKQESTVKNEGKKEKGRKKDTGIYSD